MEAAAVPTPIKPDEEPEAGNGPVLKLSSLAPKRPWITYDDKSYELHILDDFGIADQQALTQDGEEYDRLWSKPQPTSGERKRLKMVLDRMLDKVLIAPEQVKAKLNDTQRSQIVLAFTMAPYAAAPEQSLEDDLSTSES